jgi:hypothetical protein
MPCCGTIVCSGTVAMIRVIVVPYGIGVVVMGTIGVIMLHP